MAMNSITHASGARLTPKSVGMVLLDRMSRESRREDFLSHYEDGAGVYAKLRVALTEIGEAYRDLEMFLSPPEKLESSLVKPVTREEYDHKFNTVTHEINNLKHKLGTLTFLTSSLGSITGPGITNRVENHRKTVKKVRAELPRYRDAEIRIREHIRTWVNVNTNVPGVTDAQVDNDRKRLLAQFDLLAGTTRQSVGQALINALDAVRPVGDPSLQDDAASLGIP